MRTKEAAVIVLALAVLTSVSVRAATNDVAELAVLTVIATPIGL